jgi:mannose-1-phosphate guanylyltransferase
MNSSNHLIIMAGGVGNRFWPVSTREKPKQFIDVLGCGKSLLQLTVEHFKGICPLENTWIVTFEATAINGAEHLDEKATAEALRDALYADDVVITKTQLFEGTEE